MCGPHHLEPVSKEENKRRQGERLEGTRSRPQDIAARRKVLEVDGLFMERVLRFFLTLEGVTPAIGDAREQFFYYKPRRILPRSQAVREMAYHQKD